MKKIIVMLFSILMITGLSACGTDDTDDLFTPETNEKDKEQNPDKDNENMNVKLKVGSTEFMVTLQDNPTANAFKELLPMTINMSELNNNEKYYGLPDALPTNASNPGTIQNGDLMLYGSTTLVLFYKTFSTSYSYTKIGRVDNSSGLEAALGSGGISVTFEMAEIDPT